MIVEFLDLLIVNVTLRSDPALENLLLHAGGINSKANGVDLRYRLNHALSSSANSFYKLIGNLNFDVASH